MKMKPSGLRRAPPEGMGLFSISAYMSRETWEEVHKLARLEHKRYTGFGHFVGETLREAVEAYRQEREKRESGGVHEDLSD